MAVAAARSRDPMRSYAQIVSERAIVNAIVGLHATGGSTNHTIHLIAVARAVGILIDWQDFADLSRCAPLLARVYPNGKADVNDFHAAGGMPCLIRELLGAGPMHEEVQTILGPGLSRFTHAPALEGGAQGAAAALGWVPALPSCDPSVLRGVGEPFAADGGLRLLQGRLGRAVVKVSAVAPEHRRVHAPALIVDRQEDLLALHREGRLQRDFVAVVRGQGPGSNGMPELHKLTPVLGALQDQGFRVALVTDGRMSGASGKVPAAIHLSPDSAAGGPILRLRDGDPIEIDCERGVLDVRVDEAVWSARELAVLPPAGPQTLGRGLFRLFREQVSSSEQGASPLL